MSKNTKDVVEDKDYSMLRFEIGANDVCRWSSVKVERGLNYPYARSFNFSLKAAF